MDGADDAAEGLTTSIWVGEEITGGTAVMVLEPAARTSVERVNEEAN